MTRRFAAPPAAVWQAHVDPALICRWMPGPPRWGMPRCGPAPRPGGLIRIDWAGPDGAAFHLTGSYLDLTPGRRLLHVSACTCRTPAPTTGWKRCSSTMARAARGCG